MGTHPIFESDFDCLTEKKERLIRQDSLTDRDFDLAKKSAMADEEQKTEHINLKVAGQDGSVVQFKIKKHTPLRKLMQAYCDRQGLQISLVRFRFDGNPVKETDTPLALEMEDEDTIDVFQSQTGGYFS